MGNVKGGIATEDPVVDDPQNEAADNTPLSALPAWAVEVANRWRKHSFNDLKLKFDTGLAINKQYGSPRARQQRGLATIQTLALVIRVDTSEVSRMRNFAELADNFELFRAKHPDCTSWNGVKLLLAGKETGEERRIAQVLITRLKTATADLKKPKFVLDDVDLDELVLELKKLGRELQSRASITLTVAHLPKVTAA